MITNHRFKGANRVALQEEAGKLTGAHWAVPAHAFEDPEPRRGEEKRGSHQHRILIKHKAANLQVETRHRIEHPAAQHLAKAGNQAGQGVVECHIFHTLRTGHHVDKEQPRRTNRPAHIANPLQDGNTQRQRQTPG